jgi:hypothetical protein
MKKLGQKAAPKGEKLKQSIFGLKNKIKQINKSKPSIIEYEQDKVDVFDQYSN